MQRGIFKPDDAIAFWVIEEKWFSVCDELGNTAIVFFHA